jgi:7-cyano-7-deazaguanine synthase
MNESSKTRTIVLLSGGLDSAVALYWVLEKGYEVEALTFNYFLRSKREISAAKEISKLSSVTCREVGLGFLKEIDDSEEKRNPILKKAERAYIPSRNVIFYGIASSIAEISDSKYIVGGHNKDDVKNFPDASLRFFNRFNDTTKIGLISGGRTGRVILPLGRLSKSEVIKLGERLQTPFELTWSCYRASAKPCGKCHSCTLRKIAFEKAGIEDPLWDHNTNS